MEDIRETSLSLQITTGELATARVTLKEIKAALQDPARVHINMLRGEIAWTPANLRHLLGDEDLLDMIYRCEAWFSTVPEGRKMQLECQRVLSLYNNQPHP